jgi:hypothetical protein
LLFNYQIQAVGTFMHGVAVDTNIQGTAQEDLQIKPTQMTLNSRVAPTTHTNQSGGRRYPCSISEQLSASSQKGTQHETSGVNQSCEHEEDSCDKRVLVVFEQQRTLAEDNVGVANKAGC